MPARLFISDLHLSDEQPGLVSLFCRFLEAQASTATGLYILGDLFDAWVGDDDDSHTAATVMQQLALVTRATPVWFLHGNRDFLIGKDFASATGVTLLPDPCIIDIEGQRLLISHGDQLCTRDSVYQQARQMRLEPDWLERFRQRPLAERKKIAADYRRQSGEAKSLLADDIMDVTESAVENWFRQYDVDLMIHGHTHRPAVHHHQVDTRHRTRIVLPDWHDNHGGAIAINKELQIEKITLSG